jgi:hypothetical protein
MGRPDSSDALDPNFDAKARPQQGSTQAVEIRSRRSFAGASREVPFKLRLYLTLNLTLTLALALTLALSLELNPRARVPVEQGALRRRKH